MPLVVRRHSWMRPVRGLLCAALVVSSLAAHAQGFASRPVKLIVPATAGGPSDVLARTLAPVLAVELGQPVVVENVPGGGGSVAQSRLALAKPDGHTLFLGNVGQVAANPNFVGRLPYDTARDFRAIASVADAPQVLTVRADLPVRDFDQFADYVKAHAREMNWATAGIGSGAHLGGLRVNAAIGVEVNAVHYPGSAQAVTEVMAGRLDYMVESITTAVASVASGKVRAIAVLGGERSGAMPGVSAIAEAAASATRSGTC
jgi:tripartite-type tricarboxylate transporter receptor subunit TctC